MTGFTDSKLFARLVITLCLFTMAGLGWMARGVVEAEKVWADKPLATIQDLPTYKSVDVRPGDSLWKIARECYPGRHIGEMVDLIRAANPGLDPGKLQVGQAVTLPKLEVE